MRNEPLSLVEAQDLLLPSAVASLGSVFVWLICVALMVWKLVRLRCTPSTVVAITLMAATAALVGVDSTLAWLSSLALVIVGFVLFRRPGEGLMVVCVAMWAAVTWTHWGWVAVYEETGVACFLRRSSCMSRTRFPTWYAASCRPGSERGSRREARSYRSSFNRLGDELELTPEERRRLRRALDIEEE